MVSHGMNSTFSIRDVAKATTGNVAPRINETGPLLTSLDHCPHSPDQICSLAHRSYITFIISSNRIQSGSRFKWLDQKELCCPLPQQETKTRTNYQMMILILMSLTSLWYSIIPFLLSTVYWRETWRQLHGIGERQSTDCEECRQ